MRTWRTWVVAVLGVALMAFAAGCGSSSSSSSTSSAAASSSASGGNTGGSSSSTSTSKDAKIAAMVPSSIANKGTLVVAADATYAPNEFIASDGHTVIGMDADLMKALAGVMGLKVKIVNATFDSIIPGLAAGKYDVGASSFTDTKEREKTVNFVTYFTAGESFYTKVSGGTPISTIADLCGHTVAVEKGTTEADDATAQGKKCTAAGKAGVTVLTFPDQNGANLAVSSGRAQLGFADSPVAEYVVKQSGGQFKLVGQSYANAPYGIAVPKNSGLEKALLAALQKLMSDGQYKAILTHWGVEAGAINNPKINGAIS
jgi:polar amino acid transport system substrate-binding protein